MNHVHKGGKDLVSVIITLGINVSGGKKVFYDRVIHTYLGKRVHVLNIYMVQKLLLHLKDASTKVLFGEETYQ